MRAGRRGRRARRVFRQGAGLVEVLEREAEDVLGHAECAVGARDVDAAVEGRDIRGQRIDVRRCEPAAREHVARERRLRELAHLHRVFERRATAARNRVVDRAGDGDDIEIERRRQAAIEPQFLLAKVAPARRAW